MATLIASQAVSGFQPRAVHAGLNYVYSYYSITATLSAGDIIQMCKLPDGARVIDAAIGSTGYLGDAKLNVGIRADHDLFIASATAQTTVVQRMAGSSGFGYLCDTSDAATTRHTMVEVKVSDDASSSGTNGGTISLSMLYFIDAH